MPPSPPMTIARFGSAAALLPDGRVLILGGDTWDGQDTTVDTAEVYVP